MNAISSAIPDTASGETPSDSSGPSIKRRKRWLGQETDDQVGDRDPDLGGRQLGRKPLQGDPDALGAPVAFFGVAIHAGPVDRDESEFSRDEETAGHDHGDGNEYEQQLDHRGSAPRTRIRPGLKRIKVRLGLEPGSSSIQVSARHHSTARITGKARRSAGSRKTPRPNRRLTARVLLFSCGISPPTPPPRRVCGLPADQRRGVGGCAAARGRGQSDHRLPDLQTLRSAWSQFSRLRVRLPAGIRGLR